MDPRDIEIDNQLARAAAMLKDLARGLAARAAAEVPAPLLRRHLGLPPAACDDEVTARLASAACEWYARHGQAWLGIRLERVREVCPPRLVLRGGTVWTSEALARGAEPALAVAIVATTAGADADAEVDALWRAERPDESFALSAFAVAVVEHLRAAALAEVAGILAPGGLFLRSHQSPGYVGWDLREQSRVLAALPDAGPIRALESGALSPVRSTLAVAVVTPAPDRSGARHPLAPALGTEPIRAAAEAPLQSPAGAPVYRFPSRALEKWSRERLTLTASAGGLIAARFRFDGTTCSHLGIAIAMDYDVDLRPSAAGEHVIDRLSCAPAPHDRGHRAMCASLADPAGFAAHISEAPAVVGLSVGAALDQEADFTTSGCLCEPGFRRHKWRLVLETVHYRLDRGDNAFQHMNREAPDA